MITEDGQEEGQELEGQQGDEEQDQSQDAASDDSGDGQQAEAPRGGRRERQAERKRVYQERDELKTRVQSLTQMVEQLTRGQQQTTEVTGRLAETLQRQMPKEKTEVETIEEKIDEVLPRVAESPEAYREYKRLQRELTSAVAKEAASGIVSEHVSKLRQEIPQQRDPVAVRVEGRYRWLGRDEEATASVVSIAKSIAKSRRLSLQDDDTREKVLEEAAATVANMLKLPTPDAGGDDRRTQTARLSAGSGRGGGAGDAIQFTMGPEEWAIARTAYPGLPPKEQEKRFRASVQRQLSTSQRR